MRDAEWLKVAELATTAEFEADMIVSRLRSEGIPVRRVPPTSVGGLIPNMRLPVSILVPREFADQARMVIGQKALVEIASFVGKEAEEEAAKLVERLKAANIEFTRFPYTPDPEPPKEYSVRILVGAEDQQHARDLAAETCTDGAESPDG